MDKLFHDLGGIVLNALPTSIIVLILAFFVKKLYLNPLDAVLAERHRLTEGARQAADASFQLADSKVASYEASLEKARREIYAEQSEFLRKLHAEQSARTAEAKTASDATLAAARKSVAEEAAAARATLAVDSDQLATQLAETVLTRRAF